MDLLDDRARAGARRIWVGFVWKGIRSYLTLGDDGPALECEEPLARLGGEAFAHCARLAVGTRSSQWGWQADPISGEWLPLRALSPESRRRLQDRRPAVDAPTLILWEDLRLPEVQLPGRDPHRFSDRIRRLGRYLGRALHRWLTLEDPLRLHLGGAPLRADDPLHSVRHRVHRLGKKQVVHGRHTLGIRLLLLQPGLRSGSGPAPQGLFVYRGNRLLVPGDWLGLAEPAPETEGACMMVDLPEEWPLGAWGASFFPPAILERLSELAESVRARARASNPRRQVSPAPRPFKTASVLRERLRRDSRDAPFLGPMLSLVQLLAEGDGQASLEHMAARLDQPQSYVLRLLERLGQALNEPGQVVLALSPDRTQGVLVRAQLERLLESETRVEAGPHEGDGGIGGAPTHGVEGWRPALPTRLRPDARPGDGLRGRPGERAASG